MNDLDYLEREEALAILGIRKESLYTYVSRGLVRAIEQPGSKRKLYLKADVEKLRTRAGERRPPPPVARALRYGEPIVQTWISEITPYGPNYRGQPALGLAADHHSFEFVADLLWTGISKTRDRPWPSTSLNPDIGPWIDASARAFHGRLAPEPMAMLAMRIGEALGKDDTSDETNVGLTGRVLVQGLAGLASLLVGGAYSPISPDCFVADALCEGLGLMDTPEYRHAIDTMLVLSAEHELAAPTFVARISASTGASVAACVAAAMLAQSGRMQVGGMAEVEALFAAVDRQEASTAVPAGYRATDLPCFGHPLYERDPRADVLIALARQLDTSGGSRARFDFLAYVERENGRTPNIFTGLVLLADQLGLPPGSAAFLHTLGRVAGWVAHITEQRLTGTMLRPRARYVGNGSL